MRTGLLLYFLFSFLRLTGQGLNHQWLIGYDVGLFDTHVTSTKARLLFDATNVSIMPETRKMPFRATQANISDENGNLLFASNGCWIMNANKDTMLNGSGLNPGLFADDWCTNTTGIPIPYGNLGLPYPGDSNKYILFHQVLNYNIPTTAPSEVFYTVIDMTLAGGLGGVLPNQKNQTVFQDTLSAGIAACKHANGRDWWVIALKDSSNLIYKILVTPTGITSISTQYLGNFINPYGNVSQPQFSPDGKKFAYTAGIGGPSGWMDVRLFNFDRCTGVFDSLSYIYIPGQGGFGLSFSSDSKYLYHCSFHHLYQTNTDTTDIPASTVQVATYDGFCFPYSFTCTDFWLMYRAANGKIYITSGNGTIDMHFINYPDSAGTACDVQQHALHIPCYSVRGNVNHPNYYLGCDTTCGPCLNVGIEEPGRHDFRFSISPNPSNGSFKIIYLLPQNKNGVYEVYDINGRKVFSQNLPPWSTLQHFDLSFLSNGVYQCVITSEGKRESKKMAVIKE